MIGAPKSKDGWAVPWDFLISREHADVTLESGRLIVRMLQTARNAVYYKEKPSSEFTFLSSPSADSLRVKILFQPAFVDIINLGVKI